MLYVLDFVFCFSTVHGQNTVFVRPTSTVYLLTIQRKNIPSGKDSPLPPFYLFGDPSGLQIKIHQTTERSRSHRRAKALASDFFSLSVQHYTKFAVSHHDPPPRVSRQCHYYRDRAIFYSIFLHHRPSSCTPPVHDAFFAPLPPHNSDHAAEQVSLLPKHKQLSKCL